MEKMSYDSACCLRFLQNVEDFQQVVRRLQWQICAASNSVLMDAKLEKTLKSVKACCLGSPLFVDLEKLSKLGKIIYFTFKSLARASVERTARLALDTIVQHFYVSKDVNNIDEASLALAQVKREANANSRVKINRLDATWNINFIAILGVL